MARSSAGRSSLSRIVEVLDVFDSPSAHLTLSEIALRTGMAVSTAHSLLSDLEEHELVERSQDDRKYQLGVKVWEWAVRSPGAAGLRSAARPHLDQVHRIVRQHAQIGVLRGTDVIFIERLSAPDAVVNHSMIGGRTPALASSSGPVQAAFLDTEEQNALIEKGISPALAHNLPPSLTRPDSLRLRLVEIRRVRSAITDGYIHPLARGIAVPLLKGQSELLGALSVIVPNDDSPLRPVVNILHSAATRIVRAMSLLSEKGQP